MDHTSPYMEVKIENISLSNLGFIIFLKQATDENVLPICIGAAEAHSIAAAYNNHKFPRPLSHDLFRSVLNTLDCQVTRIHVTELIDGTFFARIFMTYQGRELDVDSRPSDAIALALRFDAPIFVHQDVFRSASVNINQSRQKKEAALDEPTDPIERLKAQLKKVVAEERYEDAARLRDELQRLQADN